MKTNKIQLLYFDPESSSNLYMYAHGLLSHVTIPTLYVCSKFYDFKPLPSHVQQKPIVAYYRYKNKMLQGLSLLYTYVLIFFYLLIYRPSIVHIQWLKLPVFEYGFYRWMRKLLGFRIVYTAHNILHRYKEEQYMALYQKWYKAVDAVIVHTQDTCCELVQKLGVDESKVHVIMHGILDSAPEEPISASREAELNAHYSLNGKLVFASLGAQSYYKGVDLLVSLWTDTPELRNDDNIRLVMVGINKGVDVSPLKSISNVIVEERRIPDDEFNYLLNHTDVYLLPYREISQSGALLTAIAAQVPVLATRVGGLKDPFSVASIGWTVPSADKTLLRDAIIDLVQHPEKIDKVKSDTNSWQLLNDRYSWIHIGHQTQNLYDELLGR